MTECMKCGKCRSVCPVFKESGNELVVARGKIKLIEKYGEGAIPLTPRLREAIDECLLCKTCVANCPSGVATDDIVLKARARIARETGLGLIRTLLFRYMLRWRWPLTIGASMIAIFQKLSGGIGPHHPVRLLFPLFGVSWRRHIPRFAIRSSLSRFPEVNGAVSLRKGRVALFVGCAANFIYTDLVQSTIAILTRAGYDVVIPKGQRCNGTPVKANGDAEGAEALMTINRAVFSSLDVDTVITICSSCGVALKSEFPHVLDIHEFIDRFVDPSLFSKPISSRVTYHDPCHLKRGQNVFNEPRILLKRIPGIDYVEMKEADTCCGSAGSYSVTHYANALRINEHKRRHIAESGAQIVASGCPACLMHMEDHALQRGMKQRFCFVVDLLAESL